MAGINKVIILGNLGRDPEMRYTPSGSPVTSFSVAVTRRSRGRDGAEPREETEWFNVVCWDRLAEIANQYLSKGKQVYIEGRLRTRSWDDAQSGEKKYRTEVIANEMQMIGPRQGGDSDFEGTGARASVPTTEASEFDNMPF